MPARLATAGLARWFALIHRDIKPGNITLAAAVAPRGGR